MARIDTHHHVIPPDYRKALQKAGIADAGSRALPEWSAEASLQTMSELDVSAPFVSRNDPRVRFKQAEHLLFRGDLLAFEHTTARLGNHASDEWEELLHLISELLSPFLPSSAQCRRHPLRLLYHLFGDLSQVLIQLTLLGELLLALAP